MMPLDGIRIVEMGQLIAIPHATKLLSDFGAQVIRIESCARPDGYRMSSLYANDTGGEFWNRAANFYEQNRNKLSVTLDLTDDHCVRALKELISISDVFAENFTPRVMRNFGLEYEDLRKIKPDIIMVSSTGYGYTGPWGALGAIGYTTESASGLAHMTGYAGGPPMIPEIPYADYTAAEHTVFAIMAALTHRAQTGQGQFIDVSQTETLSSTIPEALMDYTTNGRISERMGNRDSAFAPQGCYPCAGDDAWIVISVENDEQWRALCAVLDLPGTTADQRFATSISRALHHDEIDAAISEATRKKGQSWLMESLQERGVPAGAVLNAKQLLFDPHLKSRGFYEIVSHHDSTGIPPLPYTSRPWKMSVTPGRAKSAAPLLGEHNREVLVDVLGFDVDVVEEMMSAGVVGSSPSNPKAPSITPLEDQKRLGRIIEFESDFRCVVRDRYDL